MISNRSGKSRQLKEEEDPEANDEDIPSDLIAENLLMQKKIRRFERN